LLTPDVWRKRPTFEIELGTGLEGLVNELESLPHGGGNGFGSKSATIYNFKDLIIQI
jgi:hypothetical protein